MVFKSQLEDEQRTILELSRARAKEEKEIIELAKIKEDLLRQTELDELARAAQLAKQLED